jgi:hypothetical protein
MRRLIGRPSTVRVSTSAATDSSDDRSRVRVETFALDT